jgi:hypothetical protein
MKGVMTLGVREHEYPVYESVPGHHGDEANKASDEIDKRMNDLVKLEREDVSARHDEYQQLRKMEVEYLIMDAVSHIAFHMAASIRPRMDVSELTESLAETTRHNKGLLREFKAEHGFGSDLHAHDRHDTETRRERRVRHARGEDTEESRVDSPRSDAAKDGGGEGGSDSVSERSAARTDPFSPRSGGPPTHGPAPARRESGP